MAIPRCATRSAPKPLADRFVRPLIGSSFLWVALFALFARACSGDARRAAEARPRELPPPPEPIPEASDWAARVGKPPWAGAEAKGAHPEVRSAVASDATEDSAELVSARRLVYRVSLLVPPSLQDRNARVSAAAGELHIDASLQRLRARFVGPGWPVNEGVEVRLRPDVPGVYLFDEQGGRSIGPGQLAAWFEGRTAHDAREVQSRVRIRREYRASAGEISPGHLMCMLLAEWTNQPREAVQHRCCFRFGPFSAELTAVVPLQLPRYALRADDVDAPEPIAAATHGAMLDTFDALRPMRGATEPGAEAVSQDAEPGVLEVLNHTDTRSIIIVQGVPIGWVGAGQRARFAGFSPGLYRVGALRPLGILRMPPRPVRIPGTLSLGRPRTL
jgi:hypothetical protein